MQKSIVASLILLTSLSKLYIYAFTVKKTVDSLVVVAALLKQGDRAPMVCLIRLFAQKRGVNLAMLVGS